MQSIIPGILQGDKTDSLLYGSVDNGKKIAWNEKFHAKVGNYPNSRKPINSGIYAVER